VLLGCRWNRLRGKGRVSDRSAVCRALTREDFSADSLPMNLSQWPKTLMIVIGDNTPRGLFDTFVLRAVMYPLSIP
jgi:hypothetical protein